MRGQLDDIASHLEQTRQRNEEWIRKQKRAEATKEKDTFEYLGSMTEISYTEALEQANQLEDLAIAEQRLKDLRKNPFVHWSGQFGCH